MIIYRGTSEFLNVDVDNQTQLKQELLGQDVVISNFTLEFYYELKIGDYINWRGKKYTIFKQPEIDKSKTNEIKYKVEFGSDQYRLLNALYLLDGNGEFFLVGDLYKFADLLVQNLNRLAGSAYYNIGDYPTTEVKNLQFNNSNCLLVLQQICKEFGKEFLFSSDGKTINFYDKIGNETNLTFEFKEGLRNIKRKKITDKNLVTRLYPFGGERNITSDYGSKKLKIDPIENNVDIFGVIEGVVNYDEIYPHREGTITSIDSGNELRFFDTGMDFDINLQLIEGVSAKITFNSGDFSGYEFEVHQYNPTTKRFHLVRYEDQIGLVLPNSVLTLNVGDKYVLHDIKMPQSYIDNAEAELLQKATEYLNENSLPNSLYDIVPHYPYLRENLIQLNIGDVVTRTDDDFNITFDARILNITQSLANPYLYTIKVGDKVVVNYITRVLSNQLELDNNLRIERTDRTLKYNQIRRNLKDIDELRESIFDPDGYFDADNIKPLSIETSMLSVGGKSQQFIIRELLIEANYQSDANKTLIGNGTLVHFLIEDTIKSWSLTGSVKNHSDSNQFYYIYARCTRSGTTGDFLATSQQYQVDTGSTYYYFLIGVLHSAQDGVRGISLTYGQTTINGKFITTGRIQSTDGVNYFDLDSGQFFVGDSASSLDWNVTNPNKLTIKGSILQTPAGDPITIPNYRGDYISNTTYYENDTVSYNGQVYISISSNPIVGQVPTNTTYWAVYSAAGGQGPEGPQGVPGADGSDGTSLYTWIRYADNVSGSGISNSPVGKTYIGFAYNKTTATESNTPSDYSWGLMSGEGVPGPAGEDGETLYTWIKYSNNSNGAGLYDTPNSNTLYIGIAVNKTTATESTTPSDYTWSKFKGDDGPQGVPGNDGANGQTTYTWIRYADDVNGNGISNSPVGKTYLGLAYNKTTATESNTPSDYSWVLFSGEGATGPAGADGTTYYTWIKYSNVADGTGLYDTPNSNTLYIGIAVNKTTATESTNKADYVWSRFKGDDGADGQDGADGADGADGQDGDAGPAIVFRGEHSSSVLYYNNANRRDVVVRSGVYYIFNHTNASSGSWNASQWENFGAQFDSVATNLLLAENANIGDWIIKNGRITSQNESVTLYGSEGKILLDGTSVDGEDDTSRITPDGILVTANGMPVEQPTTAYDANGDPITTITLGPRATGIFKTDGTGTVTAPRVGVYGKTENVGTYDWGGWFRKLYAEAGFTFQGPLVMPIRRISSSTTISSTGTDYMLVATASLTVTLPSSPFDGRSIVVKRQGGTVTVNGNGKNIFMNENEGTSDTINSVGDAKLFVWDGVYWQSLKYSVG